MIVKKYLSLSKCWLRSFIDMKDVSFIFPEAPSVKYWAIGKRGLKCFFFLFSFARHVLWKIRSGDVVLGYVS